MTSCTPDKKGENCENLSRNQEHDVSNYSPTDPTWKNLSNTTQQLPEKVRPLRTGSQNLKKKDTVENIKGRYIKKSNEKDLQSEGFN